MVLPIMHCLEAGGCRGNSPHGWQLSYWVFFIQCDCFHTLWKMSIAKWCKWWGWRNIVTYLSTDIIYDTGGVIFELIFKVCLNFLECVIFWCKFSLYSRALQLSTELVFTYQCYNGGETCVQNYDIVEPLPNVTVSSGTNFTEVTVTAVHVGKVTIALQNTSSEFGE